MSRLFTPGRALQRAAGVPELLWAINVSVLAGNNVAESAIPNVLAIDLDLAPRVFGAHAARTIRNHPAPRHRSGGRKRRSVLEYADTVAFEKLAPTVSAYSATVGAVQYVLVGVT